MQGCSFACFALCDSGNARLPCWFHARRRRAEQGYAQAHRIAATGVNGVHAANILAAVALALVGQLPLSFEDPDDLSQLRRSDGLKIFQRVEEHAADGRWALRVVFAGSDRDTWPGFFVPFPQPDLSAGPDLVFEVFNASNQEVRLSWRVDDLDGRRVFGGMNTRPGAFTTVEIALSGMKYQLDLARLQTVYIYIGKPRRDVELFFDHFRLQDPRRNFRAVLHLPAQRPTGLPAADGPAFICFQQPWMRHLFPDDWPGEQTQNVALAVAAAQGEHEPFSIGVAARRDLKQLRAEVRDLAGPAKIPAAAIEVRVVRTMDKRWTYHDAQRRYMVNLPVLLEPQPQEGLSLAAGRVAQFWFTVRVPPSAQPGVYKGTIVFHAQAASPASTEEVQAQPAPSPQETFSCPITLRVYPFPLPEVKDKYWGVYYTGPSPFEDGEDLAKLERHLRDMRAHGMTSVGLCFGWDEAQTDVAGRRVDFLPEGRGRYETFMRLYRDLGFPAPVIQLADTVQQAVAAKLALTSAEFAEAYAGIWRWVTDYARKRKWPEIIVQPVDEPAWQGEEARERNRLLLDVLARLAPEIRTEQDGPGDEYFHTIAGPLAHVWNYNGTLAPPPVIAQAKANGKIILIYNCDVEWYRPVVDRYVAGWFLVAAGIDGCFNWAYQAFTGDPYDDLDGTYGDHLAVYPPGHGQPGGPSIAWEAFREGIDDYRYIALVWDLASRARRKASAQARELADRAEAEITRLVESLRYSPQVRDMAAWEKFWPEGETFCVSGEMNLPNGWSLADYDEARRRLADLAVRLATTR